MRVHTGSKICTILTISSCLIQPAFADDDSRISCNNKTLKGTYMYSVSGVLSTGENNYMPAAWSGLISCDGRGSMTLKRTTSVDGSWVTAVTKGAYSIQADCTGIGTYPTARWTYYVAPDGSSVNFLKTGNINGDGFIESPDRISGTAKRVSKQQARD